MPGPPPCPCRLLPTRGVQVVLERNTRNKKKCITAITGLDLFGVKLSEASKLFGKKFASGASVVKNAEGKEHIDVQVGGNVGHEAFAHCRCGEWPLEEGEQGTTYASRACTMKPPHLRACRRATAWSRRLS